MTETLFKILALDDDPAYNKIMQQILKDINLKIDFLFCNNGKEAIETTHRYKPDLIITDWNMPDMSGIEFCKIIHEELSMPDTPVIMCTGVKTTSENLKTAFDAGVVDFIRKPIDKMEFVVRINSMLRLSKSYQTIKEQKEAIQKERERSDALLNNILPQEIANELKETGKATPRIHDHVTVFISDIVDFTAKASMIGPYALLQELNDIFQSFDSIMHRHNCQRIKTVGDGYVAVCGMPQQDEKHAENIIKAALDVIEYLKKRNKNNSIQWKIRIGIDTGKLIGGIIGKEKYIYDIFGDPINTASRLESCSRTMGIHISNNTYQLVKDMFYFERQLPELIKGKGKMKMYYVKRSKISMDHK